jgi:hypothetical protein
MYLLAAIAFLGLSTYASANPTGVATITNCTPGGGVTISATTINWLPVAGVNEGCIATGLPTSISYSGGTFSSGTGIINDLPAGSLDPFLALAGGVLDFSLTAFETPASTDGICSTTVALASAHSCSAFVGSPFLFISQGASTAMAFTINGVVTDTGNSSTAPYTGLFSSTFGFTTAAIAATIHGGGSITSTYSATLTLGPGTGSTVPEPSTLAILSIGSVLIGITRRRFGKR